MTNLIHNQETTNETMIKESAMHDCHDVPSRAFLSYLAITFGLTWGVVALWLAIPQRLTAIFGELGISNPMFLLAVYAPAIGAVAVVLRTGGIRGLTRYLSRMRLWRCSRAWAAYLLVGVPATFYLGAWLKGNLLDDPFPFDSWRPAIAAIALMMVLGPVEEFGWRGVALPILQRRLSPLWAGLVLGGVWAVWHTPAFFLSGTLQSEWSMPAFFVGSVAVCVILTPFFNSCGGSILLAAVFHFQLINPLFPDAQPHDTVFFVAAAILVVVINRKSMLSRGSSITEVIPRGGHRAAR